MIKHNRSALGEIKRQGSQDRGTDGAAFRNPLCETTKTYCSSAWLGGVGTVQITMVRRPKLTGCSLHTIFLDGFFDRGG